MIRSLLYVLCIRQVLAKVGANYYSVGCNNMMPNDKDPDTGTDSARYAEYMDTFETVADVDACYKKCQEHKFFLFEPRVLGCKCDDIYFPSSAPDVECSCGPTDGGTCETDCADARDSSNTNPGSKCCGCQFANCDGLSGGDLNTCSQSDCSNLCFDSDAAAVGIKCQLNLEKECKMSLSHRCESYVCDDTRRYIRYKIDICPADTPFGGFESFRPFGFGTPAGTSWFQTPKDELASFAFGPNALTADAAVITDGSLKGTSASSNGFGDLPFIKVSNFRVVLLNKEEDETHMEVTPLAEHAFDVPSDMISLDNTDPLTCIATDMEEGREDDFVWWISSNFIYEQSSDFNWRDSGADPATLTYGFFIAKEETTMVASLPGSWGMDALNDTEICLRPSVDIDEEVDMKDKDSCPSRVLPAGTTKWLLHTSFGHPCYDKQEPWICCKFPRCTWNADKFHCLLKEDDTDGIDACYVSDTCKDLDSTACALQKNECFWKQNEEMCGDLSDSSGTTNNNNNNDNNDNNNDDNGGNNNNDPADCSGAQPMDCPQPNCNWVNDACEVNNNNNDNNNDNNNNNNNNNDPADCSATQPIDCQGPSCSWENNACVVANSVDCSATEQHNCPGPGCNWIANTGTCEVNPNNGRRLLSATDTGFDSSQGEEKERVPRIEWPDGLTDAKGHACFVMDLKALNTDDKTIMYFNGDVNKTTISTTETLTSIAWDDVTNNLTLTKKFEDAYVTYNQITQKQVNRAMSVHFNSKKDEVWMCMAGKDLGVEEELVLVVYDPEFSVGGLKVELKDPTVGLDQVFIEPKRAEMKISWEVDDLMGFKAGDTDGALFEHLTKELSTAMKAGKGQVEIKSIKIESGGDAGPWELKVEGKLVYSSEGQVELDELMKRLESTTDKDSEYYVEGVGSTEAKELVGMATAGIVFVTLFCLLITGSMGAGLLKDLQDYKRLKDLHSSKLQFCKKPDLIMEKPSCCRRLQLSILHQHPYIRPFPAWPGYLPGYFSRFQRVVCVSMVACCALLILVVVPNLTVLSISLYGFNLATLGLSIFLTPVTILLTWVFKHTCPPKWHDMHQLKETDETDQSEGEDGSEKTKFKEKVGKRYKLPFYAAWIATAIGFGIIVAAVVRICMQFTGLDDEMANYHLMTLLSFVISDMIIAPFIFIIPIRLLIGQDFYTKTRKIYLKKAKTQKGSKVHPIQEEESTTARKQESTTTQEKDEKIFKTSPRPTQPNADAVEAL